MSQPPVSIRLSLRLFAAFVIVTAWVYAATKGASTHHWGAHLLASLLSARGICDVGLVAYLRVIRKRPRRNEALFLLVTLATAAAGWYALRFSLSLAPVAGLTLGLALVRRALRPLLFDVWWADANVVVLPDSDPGLAEAKTRAVATVPEFLRRLAEPGVDVASAAVKAPIPVPGGTEHVWLAGVRSEGDEFVGMVDNEPSSQSGVKSGDTVRVRHAEISDWKLIERGQLVGGFTIRYFLSRMPDAQRTALTKALPFTIGPEAIPPAA